MSEIDVSKCRLLNSLGICASPINSKCKLCVEISEKNCYYKQLKRKEQECEKLKKECEIWKNQALTIDDEAITVQITQQQFEEYNQLKVENEKLKKTIMYKCPQCGDEYLSPIGASLYEENNKLKAENETLKQYKASKQASYEEMQRRWNEVEQENRQLKKQHESDKGLITSTGKMNYQLLQEYDKLKTENEELKIKNSILEDEYKILEDNLDSRTRDFEDIIDEYKQTLTEIKDIATDLLSLTNEYDNCCHKDECNKCDRVCQYRFVDEILQIIEGEENE